MKKIFAFILTFVFSVAVYGQELQYKEIDKDYSWRTATKSQIDSFYYDLNPVQTSKMQTHIRISLTGQVVDLFTTNGKNYNGVLTNIITEYSSVKVKGEEYEQSFAKQEVFQKIELDNVKVKYVIDSLIYSKQLAIPTDSLILNWNKNYLHCGSIYFQYNINRQFTAQQYFCPWSQNDTVSFKTIIVDNYNLIKTTFNLDSLYKQFEDKLPKGKSYSRDGYRMMYKMTDKQSENWVENKPRRDYLKSIKDTVDNYINTKLSKQKIKLVEIDCFEDYRLIFGIKGKLNKIELSKYDKPKLRNSLGLGDYLSDKKEIRKCKRIIKEIFHEIDLSFLNLEHEIYRTFSFDYNGQIQFRDDTIY